MQAEISALELELDELDLCDQSKNTDESQLRLSCREEDVEHCRAADEGQRTRRDVLIELKGKISSYGVLIGTPLLRC